MGADAVARFVDSLRPAFEAGDGAVAHKPAEAACFELVRELYRALTHGDLAAFRNGLAEDVEFENVGPANVPMVGRWKGRDEVVAAVVRNFGYLEEQIPEVQTVVAQGDTVVVVGEERGRFRSTGRPYHSHWVQIFTFVDGHAVRVRQVFDTAAIHTAGIEIAAG